MTSKEFYQKAFEQAKSANEVSVMFKTLMNELCNASTERQEELKSGKKTTKTARVESIKTKTKAKTESKKSEKKATRKSPENRDAPDVQAIKINKRTVGKLNLQYIDYSEKSFVVIGDTKPLKDELKQLTGRFNGRLNIDGERKAGWVFAKRNMEPVLKSLYLTA